MNTKISMLMIIAFYCLIKNANCQSDEPLIDSRDQAKYKVKKIGNNIWMIDNLNFKSSNSFCYENDDSNCEKYGRLYSWPEAQNSCPSGWHLPTLKEFSDLITSLGTDYNKYANSGGFNGLLSGWKFENGFYGLTKGAGFWSSTEASNDNIWKLSVRKNDIRIYYGYKKFSYSIRCVKNN